MATCLVCKPRLEQSAPHAQVESILQFCVFSVLCLTIVFLCLFFSGLAGNFISQVLVSSLSIPVVELPFPISRTALDRQLVSGKTVTPIKHPVGLTVAPDHTEQIQFYVLKHSEPD